jgi:hypothetical protein
MSEDSAKQTTDKLQQVRGVTWNWKDDAPDDAKDPGSVRLRV